MQGIDISSYQAGIDLNVVPCDFVAIKATEGSSYVNPDFNRAVRQAQALGKPVIAYHYADGGNIDIERNHFLSITSAYSGLLLALDWEQTGNGSYGSMAGWVQPFMSGLPGNSLIYCSESIRRNFDGLGYPMWIAKYADMSATGYQDTPWAESSTPCTIRQYSSAGRLPGWNGNLDLNKCYNPSIFTGQPTTGGTITMSDQSIANAVWTTNLNGTKAIDRVYGMDHIQLPAIKNAIDNIWLTKIAGTNAADRLQGIDSIQLPAIKKELDETKTAIANLQKSVDTLTKALGTTPADISTTIQTELEKRLNKIKITVTD